MTSSPYDVEQEVESVAVSVDAEPFAISYDTSELVSPTEQHASFDDGSDVLDIVETHLVSNAAVQDIAVTVQDATFAPEVTVEDVSLTGGVADWKVASIDRVSDTELTVRVERPAEVSPLGNGASVAGIELSASCVEPILVEEDAAGLEDLEEAAEGEFSESNEAWEVSVPFVVPFLAVDVADTQVGEEQTAYRLVASDFVIPEGISVEDFAVGLSEAAPEGAAVPELLSVTRIGDFEMEAVVAGNALEEASPLAFASITFVAAANGMGGDVVGSLQLPDAWVHAVAREDGETVTVHAALLNSDEAVSADNAAFSVVQEDGTLRAVEGAQVAESADGVTTVTFPASELDSAGDTPAIVVDANGIDHASGVEVDPEACLVPVVSAEASQGAGSASAAQATGASASSNGAVSTAVASQGTGLSSLFAPQVAWAEGGSSIASKISQWAASLDLSEMAFSAAKSGLASLASAGWAKARTTILADTFLGDRSNSQIYDLVSSLNDQMGELSTQVKQINDNVLASYYGNVVNDANATITDIRSDYTLVADYYAKVLEAKEGSAEQAAAIDELMGKREDTVNSLIKEMATLSEKIVCADAAWGHGLIGSYDVMTAKSYNWAGETVAPRLAYRAALGSLWSEVTSMLYVVCGSDAHKDRYASSLESLDRMTQKVEKIIADSGIEESEYQSASETYPSETKMAYYCYTTAEWYIVHKGTDSAVGWDKAFMKKVSRGKDFPIYGSENPFSSFQTGKPKKSQQWKSSLMNESQAKLLADRCRPGSSLQQELRSFVTGTEIPKYFIVGAEFEYKDGKSLHQWNRWKLDTYTETAPTVASTYEASKLHFEGDVKEKVFGKASYTVKSKTELGDMFVLAKASVA